MASTAALGRTYFTKKAPRCKCDCCCDTDHDGDVHVQSETDLGLTDECGNNCGHEGCGDGCDPVQFSALGEVYCGGPENQHGQALVGEAEVSPDCGEVLGGDDVTQSEQGNCDEQTLDCGALIHFEGFRYNEAGGAESGITTGDGQDYYCDDGEDAADGAEQRSLQLQILLRKGNRQR